MSFYTSGGEIFGQTGASSIAWNSGSPLTYFANNIKVNSSTPYALTTSWTNYSDATLKENIVPCDLNINYERFKELRHLMKRFNYIDDVASTVQDINDRSVNGFIAQDIIKTSFKKSVRTNHHFTKVVKKDVLKTRKVKKQRSEKVKQLNDKNEEIETDKIIDYEVDEEYIDHEVQEIDLGSKLTLNYDEIYKSQIAVTFELMNKCEILMNENILLKDKVIRMEDKINKMELEQLGMINLLNIIRNKLNI
jgi:hypothetical protein